MTQPNILVTICLRKGSKGVKGKNIRELLGKPLFAHALDLARDWGRAARIVVSTDSEEIAALARDRGADVPFLRPDELATDTAGKLPVLTHALRESEKAFNQQFDILFDIDATSPLRTIDDLNRGYETFMQTNPDVCFSVVPARRNPYFNMIERKPDGQVAVVKPLEGGLLTRQSAPDVFDMNASLYFYRREFLLSEPRTIWDGRCEYFEMPEYSAFDIDHEFDFFLVETLMKKFITKELNV